MRAEINHVEIARASEWHVRLRHANDSDWEEFATWLAHDPANVTAYDAVEQADAELEFLLPQLSFNEVTLSEIEAQDAPKRHWRSWTYGMTALAASIAAVVALIPQLQDSHYDITTRAGERRIVALDANSQVTLNGATRITFDRKNPRFAALRSGQALFQIHHDAKRPFSLDVGNSRITDVGTVFDVISMGKDVRVAVAEGQVRYEAGETRVALDAGQTLISATDSGSTRVGLASPATIGGWASGRLTFTGETLQVVATDLGRSLGIDITVAPLIRKRAFIGSLDLNRGDPDQLPGIARTLDVRITRTANGLLMEPRGRETP
jgi:transmembrane sensor